MRQVSFASFFIVLKMSFQGLRFEEHHTQTRWCKIRPSSNHWQRENNVHGLPCKSHCGEHTRGCGEEEKNQKEAITSFQGGGDVVVLCFFFWG